MNKISNSLLIQSIDSCFQICKIIKIHQDFPELWSQMYRHLFMVHSVVIYAHIYYDYDYDYVQKIEENP